MYQSDRRLTNSLDFIDIVNVMDFVLQIENMKSSQQQIDEIHDVLKKQEEKLNKILEALHVGST